MDLWILSALEASPTDALLLAAAHRRGHSARIVRPGSLVLRDAGGALSAPDEGLPDGVLTRTGASAPESVLACLADLQGLGVPCLNDSAPMAVARNKWRTAQCLVAARVPIPATHCVEAPGEGPPSGEALAGIVAELGPPPWYVKPAVGTQGDGVERVESSDDLARSLAGRRSETLVQEALVGILPGDLRVLVVQGEVVAAMRRIPAAGEHRANLHRGGRPEGATLSPETERVAVAAAAAVGLDLAGVDLIETAQGAFVLEVNGASGLAGLQETTEVDLGEWVVRALERKIAGS